LTLSKRRE